MRTNKVLSAALVGIAAVIAGTCFAVTQEVSTGSASEVAGGSSDLESDPIISAEIIGFGTIAPVRPLAGTITVRVVTSGHDGSFTFASTVPGASAFMLTTYAGIASKRLVALEPGTFTIAQIGTAQGYRFGSLACSGGEVDGVTARIDVSIGASQVCTFLQSPEDDALPRSKAVPAATLVSQARQDTKPEHERFETTIVDPTSGAGRFASTGLFGRIARNDTTLR